MTEDQKKKILRNKLTPLKKNKRDLNMEEGEYLRMRYMDMPRRQIDEIVDAEPYKRWKKHERDAERSKIRPLGGLRVT